MICTLPGCERSFVRVGRQLYCSARCKYRANNPAPRVVTIKCGLSTCARMVASGGTKNLRRYCCDAHRTAARRERMAPARTAARSPRQGVTGGAAEVHSHLRCGHCGNGARRSGNLVFCAQRCGWSVTDRQWVGR